MDHYIILKKSIFNLLVFNEIINVLGTFVKAPARYY